jgi:hypothetical protein
MIATTPQSSWSLVIQALADLGAREIERRTQAQQHADDAPRRDDTEPEAEREAAEGVTNGDD